MYTGTVVIYTRSAACPRTRRGFPSRRNTTTSTDVLDDPVGAGDVDHDGGDLICWRLQGPASARYQFEDALMSAGWLVVPNRSACGPGDRARALGVEWPAWRRSW